jgi:uncharacterized protein (TIGR02996 family)
MPRYEYTEGTSNKFWEIELTGSKYACKWGRIGGSTSMNSKDCGDAAAAKKAADKLIAEKLKKGYTLVGKAKAKVDAKPAKAAKASPMVPQRNAALEKAILANPEDPEPYLVLADWMQAHGEVRGELVVLQHAGKSKEANALLEKHGDWFLGPFAKKKPSTFELEWFCGYIKSAKIGWPQFTYDVEEEVRESGELDDEENDDLEDRDWGEVCKKALTEFLKHPSAQFLQELRLGCIPGEEEMDTSPFASAIEAVKPPCLRVLAFDDTGDWDISGTQASLPNSKAIQGVRALVIRGGSIGLGKIDLPELREFRVESGSLRSDSLKAIAKAKWPKLEKLEIWCGDPNYGASGSAKDLAPIFAATGLPKLVHLGIMNCPFADEAVKTLTKSKVLKQLKTLDLRKGNLSDRGIDTMVAHKDAFSHLDYLDVDDNALTDASKPKLKGLAKKTNWGTGVRARQNPDRAVPRAEDQNQRWNRYVSVGE